MDNKTTRRHAALVDRMATALGRDLQEDAIRGQLDLNTLHDMVTRCTGCTRPDNCAQFLDQAEAQDTALRDTPAYCRNAATFHMLMDGHRT